MIEKEKTIRQLVKTAVDCYASGFADRHIAEYGDTEGVINMKIHNVFIAALGAEIQFYSALVRSLDSSLGNMLEKLAINIAELSYTVLQQVEGILYEEQTQIIATLLESYKSHRQTPKIADYQSLRSKKFAKSSTKRHDSDYYLIDNETQEHFLIELKIGGDLDNKKARSEKEAILEQYAILSNELPENANIRVCFATAYNRFGENKPWNQTRVKQFFADEELLIGRNFWNLICKLPNGFEIIKEEFFPRWKRFVGACVFQEFLQRSKRFIDYD